MFYLLPRIRHWCRISRELHPARDNPSFCPHVVSHWKYKVQPNFENSKGIILKKKRPKIRLSLWKYQCKTDSRHRKNAEGKKRLMQNKCPKTCVSLWKYQCKTDWRHRKNAGEKGLGENRFNPVFQAVSAEDNR